MKLWRGNRVNQEWELSNEEIAHRFVQAAGDDLKFCSNIPRSLANFIIGPEDKGCLNSTWEYDEKKGSIDGSPDMLEIIDLIEKVRI